ncbi:hypothetical protein VTO42DRAFT_1368 [Malbranchea cinnamomea]
MAKQDTDSKSIRELVNGTTSQEIRSTFMRESQKPTLKIYPLVSSVAEPNLPPRNLTYKLVDIFMAKAQYMLPILHEPSFRQDVDDVLNGFQIHVRTFKSVLSLLSACRNLAPIMQAWLSYYLAALPFLDACIRRRDLSTLQCFALMGQYSLLTPTSTAAFWVVGTGAKLYQELGLADESTITKSSSGRPLDYLEVDMRRRIFWIITSTNSPSVNAATGVVNSHDSPGKLALGAVSQASCANGINSESQLLIVQAASSGTSLGRLEMLSAVFQARQTYSTFSSHDVGTGS